MARRYALHIDCFTSLDELKPKERSDPEAVFAVLCRTRRFSVWDMDDMRLVSSVEFLKSAGRITTDSTSIGFPWTAVTIKKSRKPRSLSPADDGGAR